MKLYEIKTWVQKYKSKCSTPLEGLILSTRQHQNIRERFFSRKRWQKRKNMKCVALGASFGGWKNASFPYGMCEWLNDFTGNFMCRGKIFAFNEWNAKDVFYWNFFPYWTHFCMNSSCWSRWHLNMQIFFSKENYPALNEKIGGDICEVV